MNRRRFLSQSFWAIAGVGILGPSQVLGATPRIPGKPQSRPAGYRSDRTIFCQFDNPILKEEIEKLARDLGCRVVHGETGSFDIIGVPCFISIVDRKLVGRLAWETFLDYRRETGDHTPCLIIDGGELKNPSPRNLLSIYPKGQKTTGQIKNLIVAAKAGYSSRYYG